MAKIKVENAEITVVSVQNEDYISLTDMAHSQMQEHIVFRWMSLKSTIEYLGEWEMLYNPNFNCTEFDTIRKSECTRGQSPCAHITKNDGLVVVSLGRCSLVPVASYE